MKNIKLFIDDERYPEFIGENKNNFIIKRTYNDTISFLENLKKSPIFISFDHDLGIDIKTWKIWKTWMDIAKWLVEYDLKNNWNYIHKNFTFQVHSQNPIWKENIEWYLNNYLQFKEEN